MILTFMDGPEILQIYKESDTLSKIIPTYIYLLSC